jgi:HEAT repeat protein
VIAEAWAIVQMSIASAAILIAFFLVLLLRRWRLERHESARQSQMAAITRTYLQRIGGFSVEGDSQRWSNDLRLAAISHLHLLLRGGERDRLMQMAEIDGLLRTTLRKSAHPMAERRIDAIRLLQQFGSEACIARLRELMTRDRNAAVRKEAAFALASLNALPPPRELIRILGMLRRKPNRLDSALLRSTAGQYAEHLQRLLDQPMSHGHRALIIDALGWSDDMTVLPTLARAAQTDIAELRSGALRAAGKLGHPGAAPWVMRLLDDPVPFVRVQAVNASAALELRDAVPRLTAMLDDQDLWVRLRAEEALEKLVGFAAVTRASGAAA